MSKYKCSTVSTDSSSSAVSTVPTASALSAPPFNVKANPSENYQLHSLLVRALQVIRDAGTSHFTVIKALQLDKAHRYRFCSRVSWPVSTQVRQKLAFRLYSEWPCNAVRSQWADKAVEDQISIVLCHFSPRILLQVVRLLKEYPHIKNKCPYGNWSAKNDENKAFGNYRGCEQSRTIKRLSQDMP